MLVAVSSGELVKDKNNVRYIGFRPANDGGRFFDFSVSATERGDFLTAFVILTSFEIPAPFFFGDNRIRLQEGVGICYAKLKYLLELGPRNELPERLCLTAGDVAQYRERPAGSLKRKSGFEETRLGSNPVQDRKIS
jgi:hypothetical protein